MIPSKTLLEKMRVAVDGMEKILSDPSLSAEVQISDINFYCWAMVQLTLNLTNSVNEELSGIE